MPLNLRQIRQNCQLARRYMQDARAKNYALGAFNLDNQETLIAVARAAKNKNAPVLVELSHGEVTALGLDNVRDMVENYKHEYGITMFINLDHSPSIEAAKAGIEAGFEFIHIDVSQANHNASLGKIVSATREVVDYARLTGAMVESEPHYFAGGSNVFTKAFDYKEIQKYFTKPESAKSFVATTGIDTFAAAIGNLHGSYPVDKILDIDLLKEIRKSITCNISLHGGSGTPEHYFKSAIKNGVSKININSDMRRVYRDTLVKALEQNPTEYAVIKLMDQVILAVQKVVESKIDMFGAAGKAVLH